MAHSLVGGGCLLGVEILHGLLKRPGGAAGWEEGQRRSILMRRRTLGLNAHIILE